MEPATTAKKRTRKPPVHTKGRPYIALEGCLRLTDEGEWIPDDGAPGLAFSGAVNRSTQYERSFEPYAFASECKCDRHKDFVVREACPARLALSKTSSRYGVANGRTFIKAS